MRKVKSLLNKMSSPMRPPAGLGDLLLTKSFVSKVVSLFITTQSAEDSRQRRSGMTALLDVKAFTLVELLVVVLIIGILSAIAIPMYQGAVDKSHWSTMLPASKAIKDAEEAFKMTNGEYSDTMEHLDVQMNNSDLTFDLQTPNNLSQPNVIKVTNSKLGDNVRLASYLDDSPMFAGQLHCEAKNGDERANRLCEKLLGGQELTSQDGYTGYLLDQDIDKATCDNASRSWSTSKTKCYKDTAARCEALDSQAISGKDMCGYQQQYGKRVNNEEVCISTDVWGCMSTIVETGGKCISQTSVSCGSSTIKNGGICEVTSENPEFGCNELTIEPGAICVSNNGGKTCADTTYNGGICVANSGTANCLNSSFKNGGKCYANIENSSCANNTYDAISCCCGNYCGGAPKCSDRGIACDPKYMK